MGLKQMAGWLVPHGVMVWRSKAFAKSLARERARGIALLPQRAAGSAYSYEEALDALTSLGLDDEQVRAGSVPKASLDFVVSHIAAAGWSRPVVGLQIGMFVGVSLAHFSSAIKQIDRESRVISIDPAVPHRGVDHPDRAAMTLLNTFDLQGNVLLITGYSLEKNISNDGLEFKGYDTVAGHSLENSSERVLSGLSLVARSTVDFAFIDGNHDPAYVGREVDAIQPLLHQGSLLFLDDVTLTWEGMGELLDGLPRRGFQRIGYDGRVAALRLA